ncbi:MAG: CO/xanthine dehydrogenase FAD-binding subunit [Planctomycetota bacterium]|jgi:CO/xanthine dehydrogenase FAD-binding subunit
MINNFEFTQPHDVSEALKALSGKGRIVPLAGGTNVLVNMKRAPLAADLVVDLSRIDALKSITEEKGAIRLGAGVSFAQLLDWRPGGAVDGLMRPMCVAFAGPLIRNLATLGGNICDASAAADASPVLLALDASVELQSAASGSRTMPLTEFFQGVRKTARREDELLMSVGFTKPEDDERWFYYKLGKRKADAISLVSVAMTVSMLGGKVQRARIALGAVAPFAIRTSEAEKLLQGEPLNDTTIAAAAAAAAKESRPIDDFRAGGDYRRRMVEVLVKRGLNEIAA